MQLTTDSDHVMCSNEKKKKEKTSIYYLLILQKSYLLVDYWFIFSFCGTYDRGRDCGRLWLWQEVAQGVALWSNMNWLPQDGGFFLIKKWQYFPDWLLWEIFI